MTQLTVKALIKEAKQFCKLISGVYKTELFGVTDGKAIGTYVEHLFQDFLSKNYDLQKGNSASGLDLPSHPYLQTSKLRQSNNHNQVVHLKIVNKRYLDWDTI